MYSISDKIEVYIVNTFTGESCAGNPAAVCILNKSISDEQMQFIARRMNLSETAFVLPVRKINSHIIVEDANLFSLRWFTPEFEVPLCGHATLAASAVLFDKYNINADFITFETKSGNLFVHKDQEWITLDFPADEYISNDFEVSYDELFEALGISNFKNIILGERTHKLVIHMEDQQDIMDIKPDFEFMKELELDIKGVGVTARADSNYDFITRYFNPWAGVNEDPVTGSVHTMLATYWSNLLEKKEMKAYQASSQGGELLLKLKGNRLDISGKYKVIKKCNDFL